jgi:hypothetical protein
MALEAIAPGDADRYQTGNGHHILATSALRVTTIWL